LTIDSNLNNSRHEFLNTSIKKIMELRKEEFPVALQAYEVRGDHEDFVAEQVVNTQTEADKLCRSMRDASLRQEKFGPSKHNVMLLQFIEEEMALQQPG